MRLKQSKLFNYLLLVFLACINSCTFKHVKYPYAYEKNISRNLNRLNQLIFNEYKDDSIIYAKNVQNASLKKLLDDLDINMVGINYKTDTSKKHDFEIQMPNNIFNSVVFLDSCVEFCRNNTVRLFDKCETTYGVSYLFGTNKPKIVKKKDGLHNLIKPINDSIFISRLNIPKTR